MAFKNVNASMWNGKDLDPRTQKFVEDQYNYVRKMKANREKQWNLRHEDEVSYLEFDKYYSSKLEEKGNLNIFTSRKADLFNYSIKSSTI